MIQGPTEIPFEIYEANKEILEDATYREGHLKKLFNRNFPEIAFRYDELRYLPDNTLNLLCEKLELFFHESWPSKRKVEIIKKAIRDASPT